jgi:hypothetical protein
MRGAAKWLGVFCTLLMLWTAAAEPTHHHPTKSAADGCSLCLTAHSATPTPSSSAVAPTLVPVGFLQSTQVNAQTHIEVFQLVIRGPPAA